MKTGIVTTLIALCLPVSVFATTLMRRAINALYLVR